MRITTILMLCLLALAASSRDIALEILEGRPGA